MSKLDSPITTFIQNCIEFGYNQHHPSHFDSFYKSLFLGVEMSIELCKSFITKFVNESPCPATAPLTGGYTRANCRVAKTFTKIISGNRKGLQVFGLVFQNVPLQLWFFL